MVWKWKYDENYGVVRVLLSKTTKKKMNNDLKENGNYSNQNDYMYGQIIHDAWEWFKEAHSLPERNLEKRELISVGWNEKEAHEIMDWATKWGLLYIVLEEYYEFKNKCKSSENSDVRIENIGEVSEESLSEK